MTIDFRSRLFTVSVLYRSLRDGRYLPDNLWEESLLLIQAEGEAEAISLAERIAKGRSIEYRNSEGEVLRWEFACVERAYEVENIVDGAEIFSRHLRQSEVESLLNPFSDD